MYQGRLDTLKITSDYLPNHNRPHYAYVPTQAEGLENLPSIYALAPWLSSGLEMTYSKPFKTSFPERVDQLISQKHIPPCIVIFPDLYTPYGGSQYIDSSYFGKHASFIAETLRKTTEKKYKLSKKASDRLILGRSSGGFGALRMAQDFPGIFGGVACHSGDLGFNSCLRGELIALCKVLEKYKDHHGFVHKCLKAKKVPGHELNALMLLGLSGFYSPNEKDYDLPIDLKTGKIDDVVWQRWEQQDPVVRVNEESFKNCDFVYVDCGNRDQYNLLYGARQLHEQLDEHNISHEYFEFDDNHSGTDYRFDTSLKAFFSQ